MEQFGILRGRLERPGALRLTESQIAQLKQRVGDTADQHYPPAARRDAVDGIVLVDLLLNVEGQVLEAQVVAESPPGFGPFQQLVLYLDQFANANVGPEFPLPVMPHRAISIIQPSPSSVPARGLYSAPKNPSQPASTSAGSNRS